MLNITASAPVAENVIAINGVVVAHRNDTDAQKVLDIVRAYASGSAPVSKPVATAPEKKTLNVVEESSPRNDKPVGKPVWQEDFLTVTLVDRQYRLYVTCPVGGEKGKAIRYAIKASAKEHGAKFAGNYDAKEIFWAFPSKAKADEFIKARKAYDKENGKH